MKNMKRIKNVSNKEIVNALLESIAHNDDALDYIQNQIYNTENILGYLPEDKEVQERLKIEKFIKFQLDYIDKSYKDALKRYGVVI